MSAWVLEYEGFDPASEGLREALCALGNGFLGTRGAAPEAQADEVHYPATYVAGVYNRLPTTVAGLTLEDESIVNLPNWLPLTFRAEDGCWLEAAEFLEHRLELDLRRGVLTRLTRPRRRRPHHPADAAAHRLDGQPAPGRPRDDSRPRELVGSLLIRSLLDGNVVNSGVARYRALAGDHLTAVETTALDASAVVLRALTKNSRILVAEAARTRVEPDGAEDAVLRTLYRSRARSGTSSPSTSARGARDDREGRRGLHVARPCTVRARYAAGREAAQPEVQRAARQARPRVAPALASASGSPSRRARNERPGP